MQARDPAIARAIRIKSLLLTVAVIAVTILVGVGIGKIISSTADRQTIEAIIKH